ncbi:MAG: cupin domain-containing protein [Anaerolineales bacterium]|nr:cupin domain-containing protein [Anaerolineales bacterium]
MKIFHREGTHLFCGRWNDSPVEIGMTELVRQVPGSEAYHFHPYHEYYLFLEGNGEMNVEGKRVPLEAGMLLMVEPGEKHEIASIDAMQGLRWVIIKERSTPDSKQLA